MTMVWLVGCSNAFNLIDGLDGLAAGIGIFATLAMVIAALVDNNVTLALLTAPLLGSLLGFLRYNFSPASIFLGDSGSLLIGFLLGCFGVLWGHGSASSLGMLAPIMAMFIPLLDTVLAIARRFARNRPIFEGDRGHIHHRLLAKGLPPPRATLLLYAAGCVAACLSLLQTSVHAEFSVGVMVGFAAAVALFVRGLGYPEIPAAWHLLRRSTRLRHRLNAQILLRGLEQSLSNARSLRECWNATAEAAAHFDFCSLRLSVDGEVFETHWKSPKPDQVWSIRIPLPEKAFLEIEREFGTAVSSSVICLFVDSLRYNLGRRLPEFERRASMTERAAV